MKTLYIIDYPNLFLTFYSIYKNTRNLVPFTLSYLFKFCQVNANSFFIFIEDNQSKFRRELYPLYKANRVKYIPQETFTQISSFKKELIGYLISVGINVYSQPDYEADDLVGHIVYNVFNSTEPLFDRVVIISNDFDYVQLLLNDNIMLITRRYIFNINRLADTIYLSQKCLDLNSYLPSGFPYLVYKLLEGDKSDNILPAIILRARKAMLKRIFSNQNRDLIDSLASNKELNLDIIKNFLTKASYRDLSNIDQNKLELNFKLMYLYKSLDNVADFKQFIFSSNYIHRLFLNKKFLFSL